MQVQKPAVDFVLQNISSPPYTDDQSGMAALFWLAIETCKHKLLAKRVKEKNAALLMIAALMQMLAVRTKSPAPASCPDVNGQSTPVTELMEEGCAILLMGVDHFVEDHEV